MNTSANINQTHDTMTSTAPATGFAFLRRSMAGTLLAAAITATAVGFAATSRADDGAPAPAPAPALEAIVPAPIAPWLPTIEGFAGGHRHFHCGFPGWRGSFRCWY